MQCIYISMSLSQLNYYWKEILYEDVLNILQLLIFWLVVIGVNAT